MNSSSQYSLYTDWSQTLEGVIRGWVICTVIPVALVVGLPGNLLILLCFVTVKSGVSKTTKLFYATMAIMDEITLVTYLEEFLNYIAPQLATSDWVIGKNVYTCMVSRYFWTLGAVASDWTLLIFSTERLFSIMLPLRAKLVFTVKRTVVQLLFLIAVCAGCSAIAVLAYKPWRGDCVTSAAFSVVIANDVLIFGFGFLLPTALQTCCSVLMMFNLVKVVRLRRRLTSDSRGSSVVSAEILSSSITVLIVSSLHVLFYSVFVITKALHGYEVLPLLESLKRTARVYIAVYFCAVARCTNFVVLFLRTQAFRTAVKSNFFKCLRK